MNTYPDLMDAAIARFKLEAQTAKAPTSLIIRRHSDDYDRLTVTIEARYDETFTDMPRVDLSTIETPRTPRAPDTDPAPPITLPSGSLP